MEWANVRVFGQAEVYPDGICIGDNPSATAYTAEIIGGVSIPVHSLDAAQEMSFRFGVSEVVTIGSVLVLAFLEREGQERRAAFPLTADIEFTVIVDTANPEVLEGIRWSEINEIQIRVHTIPFEPGFEGQSPVVWIRDVNILA